MWGCNPQWTNPDEYKGVSFWAAYKKGAKLISIDPRKGFVAKRADLWLQLRPGTDAALAMGFHSVILEEELYDKEFTQNHINGWEAFKDRVKDYPLERVQEIMYHMIQLMVQKRIPRVTTFLDEALGTTR